MTPAQVAEMGAELDNSSPEECACFGALKLVEPLTRQLCEYAAFRAAALYYEAAGRPWTGAGYWILSKIVKWRMPRDARW